MNRTRRQKPTLLEQILSEQIVCGGILYTRQGLYCELIKDGASQRKADFFAFHGEIATAIQIANAINEVPNEYPDEVREMLRSH